MILINTIILYHFTNRCQTILIFFEIKGDQTCVICMDDFPPNQLFQHVFKAKHSLGSQDETGRCNAPMCEVINSGLIRVY